MTQQFWINLPVKDISRSKAFFTTLGFSFNPGPGNTEDSACLLIGVQKAVVMLFAESSFRHFTGHAITDTSQSAEVLLSFDAESREEVDELAVKVTQAGGSLFAPPAAVQGWMYGCGFADPDGHRWNVLYMDKEQQQG